MLMLEMSLTAGERHQYLMKKWLEQFLKICFLLPAALIAGDAVRGVSMPEEALLLTVSSAGPDRYADGKLVCDGEYYALVSVRDGVPFAGFAADGTVSDPASSRILFMLPLAENGRCPRTSVALDPAVVSSGESLFLVLLDTRATARSGARLRVDGWGVAVSPALSSGAARPQASVATMSATSSGSAFSEVGGRLEKGSMQISSVPAGAESPRITGFRCDGDEIVLTVEDTTNVLDYNVREGETPEVLGRSDAAVGPVTGDPSRPIVLRVPAEQGTKARFFKIIRHGGEK